MNSFIQYYLPVFLWIGVIAFFSQNIFSGNVTLDFLRHLFEFLDLEASRQLLRQINGVVRKLSHVGEYFVFAILIWRALRKQQAGKWVWRAALQTLALVAAVAALDETGQWFRHLRTGSVTDVGIDTVGAVLALGVLWWRARSQELDSSAEIPPQK